MWNNLGHHEFWNGLCLWAINLLFSCISIHIWALSFIKKIINMQTLTVLLSMEVLSWIIISAFVIFNSFLFLWMYRNWQRSEEKKPELSEKEKQYNQFLELTGYQIEKERFIYLHSEIIRACFNIWMKGVVYFEDFHHLRTYFFHIFTLKELESIPRTMFDNFELCNKLFKYHRDNKMIFPADKFFQVFFGFGEYYEEVLNESKE